MNHFINAFKKYADFTGRDTRRQYWIFILIYTIIYLLLFGLDFTVGTGGIIASIYSLVLFLPTLSAGARRLHDIGKSGWWQLLLIIPLIGMIALVVLMAMKTQEGDNKFGQQPALT